MMNIKVITIHWYHFFILRSLKIFLSARTGYMQWQIFLIFSYLHISHRLENLLCDTHVGILLICVKTVDGVHA
jgi:hypothetical protein